MVLRLSFSCSSETEKTFSYISEYNGCTLLPKLSFLFFFWMFKLISYKNGSWSFAISVRLSCQSACSNSKNAEFIFIKFNSGDIQQISISNSFI